MAIDFYIENYCPSCGQQSGFGYMVQKQKAAASNHIVDYYGKLKSSPISKRDKVAIVACMNKTLKCLYAMVLTGTKYRYRYTDSKSTISMEA